MRLGTENARRKRRPVAAQTVQLHAGGIDQPNAIADFPTISALQLAHQRRKQAGKHFEWPLRVRRRQRRLGNRTAPEMIELAGMAAQARFDLAQTPCTTK